MPICDKAMKIPFGTGVPTGFTTGAIAGLITMAVFAPASVQAHDSGPEFIETFDTRLEIGEPGGLSIRQTFTVHPHGENIQRGLFFELPDHIGPLSDFSATLDGEPIQLEFDEGAVIVAAQEPLTTHQSHRFTLEYRADSPWWLGSDNLARLRWEPVIAQFELAWREASLRITWPDDAEKPKLPENGSMDGNVWSLDFRGPLHGDGASLSIEPVELRADPSTLAPQSLRHWGSDWPLRVFLAIGIVGLLAFLHLAWRAVGRDPDLGRVEPRNSPPDGLSPAATRFVDRMGFDETTFVSALVSLRVKRAIELSIDEDQETLRIERRQPSKRLSKGEQALVDALFEGDEPVELGPGDERAMRALKSLNATLVEEHRDRHFVLNGAYRNWGIALGLILGFSSVAAMILQARDALTPDPWVVGLGFTGLLVGAVAPLVYFNLFKAPTRAGVIIQRQIAGLKRYFEAEQTPVSDAGHFVELLPYASALGCEQAWSDRFDESEESSLDRNTADVMAWYREIQQRHDNIAVIVTIIAASAATHTATTSAGGGATAGGV